MVFCVTLMFLLVWGGDLNAMYTRCVYVYVYVHFVIHSIV